MLKQGFEPDAAVCSSDVTKGRPAPWMAITATRKMGIDAPETVIKIGDTEVDIIAGLNAGMWSVGVTKTGNMLGLTLEEQWELPEWELSSRLEKARAKMVKIGAHDVIESVADAPLVVEKINSGLANRRINGSLSLNPFRISMNHNSMMKQVNFITTN
jgi:phosphonoacetaldehyde hydrolase